MNGRIIWVSNRRGGWGGVSAVIVAASVTHSPVKCLQYARSISLSAFVLPYWRLVQGNSTFGLNRGIRFDHPRSIAAGESVHAVDEFHQGGDRCKAVYSAYSTSAPIDSM